MTIASESATLGDLGERTLRKVALGDFASWQTGFIVAIPYTIAAVFVYSWGKRSDRTGNRVGVLDPAGK